MKRQQLTAMLFCIISFCMAFSNGFDESKSITLRPCKILNEELNSYVTDSLIPMLDRNNFDYKYGIVWITLKDVDDDSRDLIKIYVSPAESAYEKAVIIGNLTLFNNKACYFCRYGDLKAMVSTNNPKKFVKVLPGKSLVVARNIDLYLSDREFSVCFYSDNGKLKKIYFHNFMTSWDLPEWFDLEE